MKEYGGIYTNDLGIGSQLFLALGEIANNENYMQKTLDFVKNIDKQHSASYTKLLEQLSDYQEYEQNWDGDGALPLNGYVVKNFKSILKQCCDENILDGWTIFPAANGSLLLQYTKKEGGINIGKNDFSYYKISGGNVKGENSLPFSPEKVVECMKGIM